MGFICPSCGEQLLQQEKLYCCPNHHSFDRAKSGYVNLLLANSKHSKMPGDNKLMVDARKRFLASGHYLFLAEAVCQWIASYLEGKDSFLLDVGCGEGYYTNAISSYLKRLSIRCQIAGIDISKIALNQAAKGDKEVQYAVASVFHLPVADNSCDLLCNLFAPFCLKEIQRVTKPGGILLMVIPDTKHLWELKQAVYETPYENQVKDFTLEEFQLERSIPLQKKICLTSQQEIDDLFKMTPYYYKTSENDYQKLSRLQSLNVQAAFQILIYRKTKSKG